MTGLKSSERGWHVPGNGGRAHYFVSFRSLCGRKAAREGTVFYDSTCVLDEHDCPACAKALQVLPGVSNGTQPAVASGVRRRRRRRGDPG